MSEPSNPPTIEFDVEVAHPQTPRYHCNLTLRDFFAAAALQGILADVDGPPSPKSIAAKLAYQFADEMLRARSSE